MTIARRLKSYLDEQGLAYEILPHRRTTNSLDTAHAAHVPRNRVAKAVLLEDERGYMMAIVPASRRIAFDRIEQQLGRSLELASETDLEHLFIDCEFGAVPPIGDAYGIPTLIDDELLAARDVYFEAGDHEDLVHMDGATFAVLLGRAKHGQISRHD